MKLPLAFTHQRLSQRQENGKPSFFNFFLFFLGFFFFVHSLDLLQLIIIIDYVKKKSWYGIACSVFALASLACIRILGTACKSSRTHEWNLKMSRERLRSKPLLIIYPIWFKNAFLVSHIYYAFLIFVAVDYSVWTPITLSFVQHENAINKMAQVGLFVH